MENKIQKLEVIKPETNRFNKQLGKVVYEVSVNFKQGATGNFWKENPSFDQKRNGALSWTIVNKVDTILENIFIHFGILPLSH